jgi:7,8-dihydropterin-6-yl-methyl-4-(beta-D-ribofuranosyl)aminobenzene 5'-phosphate synthase
MKVTALIENQSKCELKAKHGLSLYIETQKHKILFDLGPDNTLFDNAKTKGVDLSKVDIVIISHGHFDHGGALKRFLQINSVAKIYVQRKAFEPHYSKFLFLKVSVGIDSRFEKHPQIVLLDGDYQIDDELTLFTVDKIDKCYSNANNALYTKTGKDNFLHEQNLIIQGKTVTLITGCGHAGIVNIMEESEPYHPQLYIGGYHLFNPLTKKTVSMDLLDDIGHEMKKYPHAQFYTCHCTGKEAFQYLSRQIPNLFYLSCGESIDV